MLIGDLNEKTVHSGHSCLKKSAILLFIVVLQETIHSIEKNYFTPPNSKYEGDTVSDLRESETLEN